MSADLYELGFRHCLHCLLEPGRNRIDRFRFRMFVDPLLKFGSGKIGLPNPFAIKNDVVGHCMRLLENTASPAGEFDLRVFALEDSSGIFSYRFELQFFDSHECLLGVCKGYSR